MIQTVHELEIVVRKVKVHGHTHIRLVLRNQTYENEIENDVVVVFFAFG